MTVESLTLIKPVLPPELRAIKVTREMFISGQHHQAWLDGTPWRRHLKKRKKIDIDLREAFARHHKYVCAMCSCSTLLQLDHIVAQSLGGSSLFCNLRYLCGPHNLEVAKPVNRYLRLLDKYLEAAA